MKSLHTLFALALLAGSCMAGAVVEFKAEDYQKSDEKTRIKMVTELKGSAEAEAEQNSGKSLSEVLEEATKINQKIFWNAMANIKGTEITEEELRKVLDAQLLNGNMFKSLGQGALDAALWAPRKAWAFVNWASFGHPWLGLGATATALAGAQAFGTFTTHSNFAPTTWGKGAKVGRLAKIKNAVTTKIEKGLNDVEQFASTHPKIMSNVVSPILTGVGFSAAEHVLFPTVTSGLNMTKSSFNTAFNKGKGAASWTVGKGYDIACGGKNIAGKVWSKLPSLRKTTNGKQPVGK